MLLSCVLFLWMFFVAAALEHTADLGWISDSPGRDTRAVAFEFAARWRHGMAGNSPFYMPGFFAVAIAVWFWSRGKSLWRTLMEGSVHLSAATLFATLVAPYAVPHLIADFVVQEGFHVSQAATSGTLISTAQGVYSLLTWSTLIIAARWSIKLKSFKPLLVPLVLNVVLALVRPWTVADFTAMWVAQARDGERVAVISFVLIPVIAGFMAWLEVPKKFRANILKQPLKFMSN